LTITLVISLQLVYKVVNQNFHYSVVDTSKKVTTIRSETEEIVKKDELRVKMEDLTVAVRGRH
jgi:hypothetical protein